MQKGHGEVVCRGRTLKDTRCKRHLKKKKDVELGFCYQHHDQAQEEPQQETLIQGYTFETLPRKCLTVMRRGPSKSDGEGHLYVYFLRSDERELQPYYKVGRTQHPRVETRIKQWPGAILKESYKTRYNKMAERLVHILLDEERVYRYPYQVGKRGDATRFHTVRKRTGETLRDTQHRDEDLEQKRWRLPAKGKQVEWFACNFRRCAQVIEAVVAYCNTLPQITEKEK